MRVPARCRWNSCRWQIFAPNSPPWSTPTTSPASAVSPISAMPRSADSPPTSATGCWIAATAPFGFAIGAEPHWGRADDITGEPVNQYGVDFVAAADWEIVRDRVVAAFNLIYQPDTMRSNLTGTWSQDPPRAWRSA